MGKIRVGLPYSLYYYLFGPLWEHFFDRLGINLIVSKPTTKRTLDFGVREAVTDACIPIKTFHGHVVELSDKVDFLFIPRIIHWDDRDTFCPKFLGLPDMIRHGISDLPPLITPRISAKYPWSAIQPCLEIAKQLQVSPVKAVTSYYQGLSKLATYTNLLKEGFTPQEARRIMAGQILPKNGGRLNIAILGYPYVLYDDFLSARLITKLRELGARVFTPQMVDKATLKTSTYHTKPAFWHFSDLVLRSGTHFFKRQDIHGVLHLTAFGCGPDFLVNKSLELLAKEQKVPFLTLGIDELSGEAGLITRIEAFIDMLNLKHKEAVVHVS